MSKTDTGEREKALLLSPTSLEAGITVSTVGAAGHPRGKCPFTHHVAHCLAFVALLALLVIHHIFHRGHSPHNPHYSDHLWLQANGTLAYPPKAFVVHYSDTVNPDSLSLRFHKYVRATREGEGEEGAWEDLAKRGHKDHDHEDDDEGGHKKWFARCDPTFAPAKGVAHFGPDCVDAVADYDALEAGQTLTYALIVFGKKKGAEHEKEEELDVILGGGGTRHGGHHNHDGDGDDDDDKKDKKKPKKPCHNNKDGDKHSDWFYWGRRKYVYLLQKAVLHKK
ncbi:hypothetical protein BC830DRAFT_37261 [Chytriomyces sp. MP71]|nr:hypothetical protein BC830DRAFT_37261 [Chytriomyces sp. MP71]